jgi:hypothetical protein
MLLGRGNTQYSENGLLCIWVLSLVIKVFDYGYVKRHGTWPSPRDLSV